MTDTVGLSPVRPQSRVNERRSCQQCGSDYLADRVRRRYCSLTCSSRAQEVPKPSKPVASCGLCGDEFIQARRDQRFCSHGCRKRARQVRSYGLDASEYRDLLDSQGGCCAACSKSFEGIRICIDHSHETGLVRGLLCSGCNIAAGHMEKRQDAVAAYLACHALDLRDLLA